MTNKSSLNLALFFVLFTSNTTAQATTIPDVIEDVNITFSNSATLTGEVQIGYGAFGYNGYNYPGPGPTGLHYNGEPLWLPLGVPNGESINAIWWNPPNGIVQTADIGINILNVPNLAVSDFAILSGGPWPDGIIPPLAIGVSGSVSCVSGCDGLSAVPLPATLPLYAFAVLLMFGLGALRKRSKNNNIE